MDVFLARQPIFLPTLEVYGYELLFRSGPENRFDGTTESLATSGVLHSLLTIGVDAVTAGRPAFINFGRDLLCGGQAGMLSAAGTVVELLEGVEPDDELLAACKQLKADGYRIALDDFEDRDSYGPLLDLADIVKVDFTITDRATRRDYVERLRPRGIQLVAEKVETPAEFAEAATSGFDYFQGYFFSRPAMLSGRDVPAFSGAYLKVLEAVQRREIDLDEVEDAIRQDLSLSYKLLSYLNAAAFGWRRRISSVRHALVLLGEADVRRWASLLVIALLTEKRPQELAVNAAVRARLCESLADLSDHADTAPFDAFCVGMFSTIDAVLDRPLAEALAPVPLSDAARAALLGDRSGAGAALRAILDAVIVYERGDWAAFPAAVAEIGVDEHVLPGLYFDALQWAMRAFR